MYYDLNQSGLMEHFMNNWEGIVLVVGFGVMLILTLGYGIAEECGLCKLVKELCKKYVKKE
jgi:hypothetical protein